MNKEFGHGILELSVSKEEIDHIHKEWDADPAKMECDLSFITEHICGGIKRTFDREVDIIKQTINAVETMNELGYCKGDKCNRDGCEGIIDAHEKDGCCSCHINPPCSYCETSSEYCPICGWDAKEEKDEIDKKSAEYWMEWHKNNPRPIYKTDEELFNELPNDKIGYVRFPSGRSFICLKGKYPEGTTTTDIKNHLGVYENPHMPRFKRFGDGIFELTYFCD